MAVPRRTKPRLDTAMPEITRIGRVFAERRVALRLTQQTLADLAGVSRSASRRSSGAVVRSSLVPWSRSPASWESTSK